MMQLYIETRYFCDFINGKHKDFQAWHNPPGLKCIKIILKYYAICIDILRNMIYNKDS